MVDCGIERKPTGDRRRESSMVVHRRIDSTSTSRSRKIEFVDRSSWNWEKISSTIAERRICRWVIVESRENQLDDRRRENWLWVDRWDERISSRRWMAFVGNESRFHANGRIEIGRLDHGSRLWLRRETLIFNLDMESVFLDESWRWSTKSCCVWCSMGKLIPIVLSHDHYRRWGKRDLGSWLKNPNWSFWGWMTVVRDGENSTDWLSRRWQLCEKIVIAHCRSSQWKDWNCASRPWERMYIEEVDWVVFIGISEVISRSISSQIIENWWRKEAG